MKHALLITAYNEYNCFYRMLQYYTNDLGIDCYVHIDKKSTPSPEILTKIRSLNHVIIVKKYKINWGSYKHPLAFVYLMKLASKHDDYDFYHLISANTFIGVSKNYFYHFFEKHASNSFIEYLNFKNTEAEKDIKRWYQYYRFQFLYNRRGKHSTFWNNFEYYGIKIQERLGIERKIDFTYKGYVYCHLTSKDAKKVLTKYRQYIRKIKYCHVGEEFFFQNMLLDSDSIPSIINNSLIFDDWSADRERPAVLREDDLPSFIDSHKLFLRKVTTVDMINHIIQLANK